MARYSSSIVSQSAMPAGAPSGTTVNGYIGYLGASATAGFRLRRLSVVCLMAGVPTSQQLSIQIHRQTVAPAGTGLAAAVPGEALEIWTPTDPTAGLIATTASAIGTTGPTINTNPIFSPGGNTQSWLDVPWEAYEEIVCNKGTANGIAFVNVGAALPTGMTAKLSAEWEV